MELFRLEKASKTTKPSLAKATTKPCPQMSHPQRLNPEGWECHPRLFMEQEGRDKVLPAHDGPAHIPEPPHISGRGLGTQTVLDTTCSRSRAGPAAVFSRKMLQGCDTSLPHQKCETGTFSVPADPPQFVQFTFSLPLPRKPGVTQDGLPKLSFLHSNQEQTQRQERKHCPDPPPNITQAGLEHTSSTTCPAHGLSLGLPHLLFH